MTNGKWEGEGGKWLLAHRVSYLLLSNPDSQVDSQVNATTAHWGKTKYIEFGSGCDFKMISSRTGEASSQLLYLQNGAF